MQRKNDYRDQKQCRQHKHEQNKNNQKTKNGKKMEKKNHGHFKRQTSDFAHDKT